MFAAKRFRLWIATRAPTIKWTLKTCVTHQKNVRCCNSSLPIVHLQWRATQPYQSAFWTRKQSSFAKESWYKSLQLSCRPPWHSTIFSRQVWNIRTALQEWHTVTELYRFQVYSQRIHTLDRLRATNRIDVQRKVIIFRSRSILQLSRRWKSIWNGHKPSKMFTEHVAVDGIHLIGAAVY